MVCSSPVFKERASITAQIAHMGTWAQEWESQRVTFKFFLLLLVRQWQLLYSATEMDQPWKGSKPISNQRV